MHRFRIGRWLLLVAAALMMAGCFGSGGGGKNAVVRGSIAVKHVIPGTSGPSSSPRVVVSGKAAQLEWAARPFGEEELIVGLDPQLDPAEAVLLLERLGFEVLDALPAIGAYLVRPWQGLSFSFSLLSADAHSVPFRYVERNGVMYKLGGVEPNDPLFPAQWNYHLIRVPQAWSTARGKSSVRIAVLDTGVDASHPDLAGRIDEVYGYSFASWSWDFTDKDGHGTHVAGIIGAVTNNELGTAGVMWDVDILPIKVLGDDGTGGIWEFANGLLYAVGLLDKPGLPQNLSPAQVVNLSLGTYEDSPVVREAVRQAHAAGAILVAAAGNDGCGEVMYPAAYPEVIAVGAVALNDAGLPVVAGYSNYGPNLDFVAPGGDAERPILSTLPQETYGAMMGTSMAAPHVSGVIGLMLAAGIPPSRVLEVLQRTSTPLGPDRFSPEYGWGLVNAHWAVNDVDGITVMVGTGEEQPIKPVAQTTISPQGGSFVLKRVPAGEYQVFAWLDVVKDGRSVEPGDFFGASSPVRFQAGREYVVSGYITEVTDGEGVRYSLVVQGK